MPSRYHKPDARTPLLYDSLSGKLVGTVGNDGQEYALDGSLLDDENPDPMGGSSQVINLAREYGLRPGDDITAALRDAMSLGRKIHIPGTPPGADNDWILTDDLPLASFDQIIEGDGFGTTRLRSVVADKHAFRAGALAANRLRLRDMKIQTLGTGSPLYFPSNAAGSMYWSEFNGLILLADNANAMHLGAEFHTMVRGCQAESQQMHAFFVSGGNTTMFEGCYALGCGADKAGYRSLGGGQFNSCNGINFGGMNFWFGSSATPSGIAGVGAADANDAFAGNTIVWAQLINCNMEAFTKYGVKSIFQGNIKIDGGKFASNVAGYVAFVDAGANHDITLSNRPRQDVAGSRQAYVADGVATPLVADYNRRATTARYLALNETALRQTGIMTSATSVRPMASVSNAETSWTTMVMRGSTTPGTSVIGTQLRYEMRGESVRLHGRIVLTTKDAAMAGAIRLENLPVMPNETVGNAGMAILTRCDGLTLGTTNTQFVVQANSGQNYLQLRQIGGNNNISDVNATQIAQGAELFFDLTYWGHATA